MTRRRGSVAGTRRFGLLVLAAVALVGLVGSGCGSDTAAKVDHRFVIPKGAADRISGGESIVLMPPNLKVRVGDTITVVNNDTYDQDIGPYFVRAGETLRQTFKTAGVLQGECLFASGGVFKITVSA